MRVALFHTELSRDGPGLLYRDLIRGGDAQIDAVVRVLGHIDADILVLGGIDHDHAGLAIGALADRLGGYPYVFHRPPNRGLATGADLNRDGRLGGPDDALGFGPFRGSEGLAVLSRLPLAAEDVDDRTVLPWIELADHIAPDGTTALERVSTTAHWRLPVDWPGGGRTDLVIWHATPPVFDGREDRNGRRNHDEARLAHDMVGAATNPVIVAAFANLDPVDGAGRPGALLALLTDGKLWDRPPTSAGGAAASKADGGANLRQRGDPAQDTVDWPDGPNRPGNLRVDLLVPDRAFEVSASGVFWPEEPDLFGRDVRKASRHRVVWMDLVLDRTGQSREWIGGAELR